MSLLEHYEQQYSTLIADITACIGRLNQNNGPERREQCIKIDAQLTEAHELLEQIGLEIRELNPAHRQSFTSKLNCYQVELKRLQSEYKDVKQPQTIIELGAVNDFYDDACISDDQRQRLLENSEQIERTGNRLSEGYRVALETESLGAQVLGDLHHQRETIRGARARLRETNAELGRASRTLNSMLLRALREKAVLYCVGVFFVLAVLISLYLTFSSSSQHEK